MVAKTITRATLADAVHFKVGLSRTESSNMVDLVIEEICAALESGESVKLSGFGSFNLHEKGERIGRNPKTMVEAVIAPRKVIIFKASTGLKDAVASLQMPSA